MLQEEGRRDTRQPRAANALCQHHSCPPSRTNRKQEAFPSVVSNRQATILARYSAMGYWWYEQWSIYTHPHPHTKDFQLLHELNPRQKNSKISELLFLPAKVAWLLMARFNNQQENEIEKRERGRRQGLSGYNNTAVTELFHKKCSLHNLLVIWWVQQCLEVPPIITKPCKTG